MGSDISSPHKDSGDFISERVRKRLDMTCRPVTFSPRRSVLNHQQNKHAHIQGRYDTLGMENKPNSLLGLSSFMRQIT